MPSLGGQSSADAVVGSNDLVAVLRSARGSLRVVEPWQQAAGEQVDESPDQTSPAAAAGARRRSRTSDRSRSQPSDNEVNDVVAAAVDGDRPAIEHLLAMIRPMVVRYCRARMGTRGQSFVSGDDVAQEVFLAVLAALPNYRDQGRPFLAFVYGIAAHKVIDARRAAARNPLHLVPEVPDTQDPGVGPEQRAMQEEQSEWMGQLLDVLNERQREILLLRVVVGLSAEETAEAVGSSPGAVRVAQHRALTRLRKALARD